MRFILRSLVQSVTVLLALGFHAETSRGTPLVGTIDFNANGADFTVVSTNNPVAPWTHNATRGAWAASDQTDCGAMAFRASRLNSPVFTVVAPATVTVSFNHRYSF